MISIAHMSDAAILASVTVILRQWTSASQDEFVAEAVFTPIGEACRVDHAMVL